MKLSELVKDFIEELKTFSYTLSVRDHVWNVLFPDQNDKWHHINVNKYEKTFYIVIVTGDDDMLEYEPEKGLSAKDSPFANAFRIEDETYLSSIWEPPISSAFKWLKVVKKDWIKANKRVQIDYPLNYRYGTVPNALVQESLSDIYRLDEELGKDSVKKMVALVESRYFFDDENIQKASMTADDFFEYCRIAYIAGKREDDRVDESLTGREMYKKYADGRHEGLLDIDPDSEQEFADWIDGKHPKKTSGGHPWEIKRGGNTTHIDLAVYRPRYREEGFKIELRGESIGRMVETVKMFLALQEAGLPISIAEPEAVRKRLLGQDRIGIIPSYSYLHRANQHFSRDEDVYDVMHYDDLGRYKRRITPFITWEPLPVLKPGK